MAISFCFPNRFNFTLLIVLLLTSLSLKAQKPLTTLSGRVVDENQQALPFAQVSLKKAADSANIKTLLADENGKFSFQLGEGKYLLELKMMGYATFLRAFTLVTAQNNTLGDLTLQTESRQLSAVTISAAPPFVERRADKLIVNLNGLGSGAPIMEVMNQLPGVSVMPDDRITLNGKSVQIYLDGKAATLSTEALAGMLKGISSSAIQKVELIAQPSAKYDAAGNGAIINIIRKRNYASGFNGNVYTGVGKGAFGKANGGLNLNYKGKAYNLLANLDYNYNRYFYNSSITSDLFSPNGNFIRTDQADIKSMRDNANYTPNIGLDLYLSKRTTLSASVKPGFQRFSRDSQTENLQRGPAGNSISNSQFNSLTDIHAANFSSGLRLQHQIDSLGKELSMDLDYYRYSNLSDQDNQTFNLLSASSINSILNQDRTFDVYALKADYTHPIAKGHQMEAGLKSSYVNSTNSNFYQDSNSDQTDLFFYKESISALYFTYSRTGEKLSYQLGLRGEYTYGQGEQGAMVNQFSRHYLQAFPSLHLDYKFTKSHSLSLGLNKRIERPGYENLNPLTRLLGNNNLQQGNPGLKPLLAYNADAWYSYKNAFFFGLTYSYSKDDFTSISLPLSGGKITTQPGNADYGQYLTMQAMYGKQVKPWWYTSSNAILSKRSFKGELGGVLLESEGMFSLSATSYNSFQLSKSFSVMFLFNYRGKSIDRTITSEGFAYLTAGIRQQLLKKRASIQLNAMDIFKSYRNRYFQDSGNLKQHWNNTFETRMVKFNLNYNFGGTIKNTRKSSGAEDEKKRGTISEN